MKSKLAPRHIIPVVCYAVLFLAAALLAIVLGVSMQNLEVSGGSSETELPLIGLVAVGIAVASLVLVLVFAIFMALLTLFPLIFSITNITKRNRKLAVACLVFDANFVFFFVFLTLFSIFSANTPTLPLTYVLILALCTLSLVMNILKVKKNKPVEAAEPSDEPLLVEQTEDTIA